jgi:hypothetical protein
VRLAGLVTLYEALDDGRPVGIEIKGISQLVRECNALRVQILKREEFSVSYLLTFALTFSASVDAPADLRKRAFNAFSEYKVPKEVLDPELCLS